MPLFHLRNYIPFLFYLLTGSAEITTAFTPSLSILVGTSSSSTSAYSTSTTRNTNVQPLEAVPSRRAMIQSLLIPTAAACVPLLLSPDKASAAPPIAIIAEELGYFPVTNRQGDTRYVPAKVKRSSTDQSKELAKFLSGKGAIMYGTYWCGHTSHQKELFGREAWEQIQYVECSPKGVYFDSEKIAKVSKNIDGFPTWYIPNEGRGKGQWVSGEMPLERIASLGGYKGDFDVLLEGPEGTGVGAC